MFQRASLGVVAGLVVGFVVVGALLLTDTRVHSQEKGSTDSAATEQAADAFVAEWQRMRTGTWTVDSKFVRSNTSGQTLTSDVHEAQRPPLRMRTSFGTTNIALSDKTISCAPDSNGSKGACREAPNQETYEQSVQQEVASVRTLVTGEQKQYSVTSLSDHCYELEAGDPKATTWGRKAKFCFDEKTGAVASSEITQISGTDQVTSVATAVVISPDVKDADFQPPAR